MVPPGPRQGTEARTPRRQREESVSWTVGEQLRCLWHRLRLTVSEMNYAANWMLRCPVADRTMVDDPGRTGKR